MKNRVSGASLHTVCQEAGCPNIHECWEDREATFLIGGDTCSRRCDFCQIKSGRPSPLDRDEPRRVAESIQEMGLRYATITGVTRDDLDDEGAWLYAEVVRKIHELNPNTGVENLTPDFSNKPDLLDIVFDAEPEVFAHNLETVPRIFKRIRPAFKYDRSLEVIHRAHKRGLVTKSNLILGMGETKEEVQEAIKDMVDAGTDILTITQYLRPSPLHHPIERWVKPEEFMEHSEVAYDLGIKAVMSGCWCALPTAQVACMPKLRQPAVRSSQKTSSIWLTSWRVRLPRKLPRSSRSTAPPRRPRFPQLVSFVTA